MKRPIKSFVVEVRKGQKSQRKTASMPEAPSFGLFEEQPRESDALRRAEAALFGGAPKPDPFASSSRSGRILETIPDEAIPAEALPVEGKRRGRPPGSRNKPKDESEAFVMATVEAPSAPKRRGRPPRMAEGTVRKVELTPELANAALESIARAGVTRAPIPTRPGQGASISPVKQPRGPKRVKVAREKPVGDDAAAFARSSWSVLETPTTFAPAPVAQPRGPLDTLPRLVRIATELAKGDPAALLSALRRPRAGERWKRRLRGAALVGYERRLKKSIAAPR